MIYNIARATEENEMFWKLKKMEYVKKVADQIGEIIISGVRDIINQLKEISIF